MAYPSTLSLYRIYSNETPPLDYPDDERQQQIVQKIMELLDGLPMSTALQMLTQDIPNILASTHLVDATNDRYQQLTGQHPTSSPES